MKVAGTMYFNFLASSFATLGLVIEGKSTMSFVMIVAELSILEALIAAITGVYSCKQCIQKML